MGGNLLKNYDVDKEKYMIGGYNCLWNVHKGFSKLKEGDLASVFIFEKKKLDKLKESEKEFILNTLRKEAQFLVKYKIPGILSINESLVEDKNTLIFATEYVPYSLTTLLDQGLLTILELKILLIELIDTLIFLHEDGKVIHSYLNPDSIFIDDKGKIKLSGFHFAITDPSTEKGKESKPNISQKDLGNRESPNLSFIAPECIIDSVIDYKSDIFSFGVILTYLIKKIKKIPISLTSIVNTSFETYQRNMAFPNFKEKFFNIITADLKQDELSVVSCMLERNISSRYSAKSLKEHPFFKDQIISAIRFIESLETNEANKNTMFFQQFPNILEKFEDKIITKKILPKFVDLLKLENFIGQVLPGIFLMVEKVSINFEEIVWPNIKNIFKLKAISAGILYFLITKIEFISKNISREEFSNHMLGVICKSLDTNLQKLQKAVFDNLSVINKIIESQAFKNHIYQRMISIVVKTTFPDIRMQILDSLKSTFKLLDQITLNDSFLSTLEKIRKIDTKSDICLKLVEIYEEIAKTVSIEVRLFY